MEDLFKRYLNNQCSPSEVKELLAHFSVLENEEVLRGLISACVETPHSDNTEKNIQILVDETYSMISAQINAEEVKMISVFMKRWFQLVAAAALLMGFFGLYTLMSNAGQSDPEVLRTNVNVEEIRPGSNKAVLSLADGSIMNLENTGNGELVKQGATKIFKPENGQLVYLSSNEKSKDVLLNSISTPRGGQYQLTLSDGTRAWLNAASTLHFPVTFGGSERKVEMTGEVYFEVAKNAAMPFIVNVAGKTKVEVLGTHFNINSYNDEKTVNTTLLEGSVKVIELASGNSRVISPGEQVQSDSVGRININKNADAEMAVAWKNGMFNFNGANLELVLRQISRWYDVDVFYEGPIPQMQFGGEMQRDLNLSQVLTILEKNNVRFRTDGKKLIVLK